MADRSHTHTHTLLTPVCGVVNRQWEEAEMLVLLQVMFTDLDFLTALHIELDVLQNFLFEVYCHYNSIPFHNFRHCFCVTQMVRTGGDFISLCIFILWIYIL